jgi:hypothetical protein
MGVYGTEYRLRALVTAIGLGANRPQDAIYPVGEVDADGKPFDGANRYVMHFPPGQLPPVDGFWSLTMYDDHYFFVPNELDRYTLSARSTLKHNADGSIDLYLQASDPGAAKEANWLPTTPSGKFIPDDAPLLAEGDTSFDPRWHLETAASPEDWAVGNYVIADEPAGCTLTHRPELRPPAGEEAGVSQGRERHQEPSACREGHTEGGGDGRCRGAARCCA